MERSEHVVVIVSDFSRAAEMPNRWCQNLYMCTSLQIAPPIIHGVPFPPPENIKPLQYLNAGKEHADGRATETPRNRSKDCFIHYGLQELYRKEYPHASRFNPQTSVGSHDNCWGRPGSKRYRGKEMERPPLEKESFHTKGSWTYHTSEGSASGVEQIEKQEQNQ